MKLLRIELQHDAPLNSEQNTALDRLSITISGCPGFVWKTFSRNIRSGQASGVYVFEDAVSAQLYSCRFALQMSALGIARINSHILAFESAIHLDEIAGTVELLFAPATAQRHRDDLVA